MKALMFVGLMVFAVALAGMPFVFAHSVQENVADHSCQEGPEISYMTDHAGQEPASGADKDLNGHSVQENTAGNGLLTSHSGQDCPEIV